MTPSLMLQDRRLSMRYMSGPAFSFRHIRHNATSQQLMDVADAFSSIQDDVPTRVISTVTSTLVG
jgi:hypothetical protein